MLLLVIVFVGVGAGMIMLVIAFELDMEFVNAMPLYVLWLDASHNVFETPKLVDSVLPLRYQFVPATSSDAATLPPLSLSVTTTFVGTFAEATMGPNDMEFGDRDM